MNLAFRLHVQRPIVWAEAEGTPPLLGCAPLAALAHFGGGGGGSSSQSTTSTQTNSSVADSYNKTKSTYKSTKQNIKNSGNTDNSVRNITKNITKTSAVTGNTSTGGLDTLTSLSKAALKDDSTSMAHKKNKKQGSGFKLSPKMLLLGGAVALVAVVLIWRRD